MQEFPKDIYTEPEPDVDTLANLGPLTAMAGIWTGSRGLDVNPKADGPEKQAFIERIELQPIDAQTNGPQLFYGLRYHTHIVKPNDVETLNNFGQLLALQGNFTAALAAYQKALALDPQFAKAYFNLGRLFVRSGEFAKAISSFQQALKLSPDTAEVHAGLGDAYARSGNLDQAIVHLDAAVKLKPQLADVQLALARLLEARGSKTETAKHYPAKAQLPRAVSPDTPTK